MKRTAYLIHIPGLILGFLAGTLIIGIQVGFNAAQDWWLKDL